PRLRRGDVAGRRRQQGPRHGNCRDWAGAAFAFACNTHNERAVAVQGNITFIRPGKLGDLLVATAREISRSGRSGIYDVRVTAGDVVIAEFRGHSRTIAGTWLPSADNAATQK